MPSAKSREQLAADLILSQVSESLDRHETDTSDGDRSWYREWLADFDAAFSEATGGEVRETIKFLIGHDPDFTRALVERLTEHVMEIHRIAKKVEG